MKRFRFRFETVLSVRKRLEDEALKALAVAQMLLAREVERKQRLLESTAQAYTRVESLGDTRAELLGTEAFRTEREFISGNKARVIQAEQAIFRANRNVEKTMRAYLQARRSTRTIEIIREKDYENFRKQLQVQEQKELDDLNIMRSRFRESGL